MAAPVTTYPAAAPVVTYTSSAAAQPITTYQSADGQPITYVTQGAPITTYTAGNEGLPQATSMVVTSPYAYSPYPAPSVDHSQGKWFAPGEPLPPGFVAVPHPEGHMEPQAAHSMTDAVKSMKGFASEAPAAAAKAVKSKKSKKKKSSGCC
mmetsp:Transcript_9932/g.18464  ORF Transcript_9932/g.18464 Transcript_9932/m.18464 type:complete len:151 (+) Transcript_9932:67-519(+)